MRLRSSPVLGLICFGSILAMDVRFDCKDVAANGVIDALWFGASLALNPGAEDGVNCWDLDGDGVNDPDEDVNGDGAWNALDCQGAPGEAGTGGERGAPGTQGSAGEDGQDGLNCWDLNGDGIANANEDLNGDGAVDALDCQGADGQDLTGVIARGLIPADADFDPASGVGIAAVYRPEDDPVDPVDPPTQGRYRIYVDLPDRAQPYAEDEIIVLITPKAPTIGGGGGGGPQQLIGVAEWKFLEIDNDENTLRIEVWIYNVLGITVDADFSIAVLLP